MATAVAHPGHPSDLRKAREASAPYRNLDVAKADGYGLLTDAQGVACIDNPGVGGMGIHYVKNELVGDAVVDATKPEALVYELHAWVWKFNPRGLFDDWNPRPSCRHAR